MPDLKLVAMFLAIGPVLCGGAERATATGKVVDADGKPVEHATVLVYSAGVRKGYSIYCPTCWVDCGKKGTTDAEGNYSIGGLDPDLVFKLLALHDGYSATFVEKVDPAKGPAEKAVLKTRTPPENPAQVVRGQVVDNHGLAVRDAVVEQQGVRYRGENGQTGMRFGPVDWIDLMAVTNQKGEFEIAYDRPAESMILSVTPRGMAAKLFTLPTGSERKTLTVASGATIRGRLAQNGKPVANAEIGVTTHSRLSGTTMPEMRIGTKEDGTFAITNVPAGRIYYLYGKMESLAARGVAADVLEFETKDDGEEVNLGDIQVKPAYSLRGKVELTDGKAIPPDMHVNVFSDRAQDMQSVGIAEDGTFEIKGLDKGVYELAASVKGYRLPLGRAAQGQSVEVLVNRDVGNFVVRLEPAAKP